MVFFFFSVGYEVIAINNQESIFSREKKSKQEKDKVIIIQLSLAKYPYKL